MEIKELIFGIEGMNERFAILILKYIDAYLDMSSDKDVVLDNFIRQIKNNFTSIQFKTLDGVSGAVSGGSNAITLDDTLDDRFLDNTFLHEFTHLISKNEFLDDGFIFQANRGLKVGRDNIMDFDLGFELPNWETDGNNYASNKAISMLDEWVTEWLANKMSGLVYVEVKEDANGFFRKKTCHGYDGSNIMNLLELVYGCENIANLITGFDMTEEQRKTVIPIQELHKLNQMIDSEVILLKEEKELFEKLSYMNTPNITGLLTYYISQYQRQNNLQDYNVWLQKMLNLLVRAYSFSFKNKINDCSNIGDLNNVYNELSIIQNSMIWTENLDLLYSLESYQLFDKMRKDFSSKVIVLNANLEDFSSLFFQPSQLLEKFKLEEKFSKSNISDENLTIKNKI